jgi:hypothetical protein
MNAPAPMRVADGFARRFGHRLAVDRVGFTVGRGEVRLPRPQRRRQHGNETRAPERHG